jgi:phosphate transport system substrate-binding protein
MSTPDEKMVLKSSGSRMGMYAILAVLVIVIVVLVVAWQAGWLTKSSTNSTSPPGSCTLPSSVPLLGAGSSFVGPLMYSWETSYSHSSVNYQPVGSGAGITSLTGKSVDFGASDAPLSAAQKAVLPGPVVTIPETAGGVAVIYNVPGLAAPIKFNGSILADIFMGTINNWNDTALQTLNVGVTLPTQSIIVVHRSDGSGTSFAFSDYLTKSSSAWASAYGKSTTPAFPVGTGEKGSSALAGFVQVTSYTIGYVDMSYALTSDIAMGKVVNPYGNYLIPSVNNTASAVKDGAGSLPLGTADWYNVSLINEAGSNDYPITTFSYLMVYTALDTVYGSSYNLEKAKNLVDFLNWTITYGQAYSGQLYYVPLPSNVVTEDQASIALVQYGGAAVPVCTAQ